MPVDDLTSENAADPQFEAGFVGGGSVSRRSGQQSWSPVRMRLPE